MKLSKAISRNNNNFNLIRLLAALMVIFGHSFRLFNSYDYQEPIEALLKFDYSGTLALLIFFFLSGIYIAYSFENCKTPVSFLLMRIFRIWPALIVCLLVTVFIFGPILSTEHNYFFLKQTWKYLIMNGTLIFSRTDHLPGVFQNNYYPGTVNGSLWTLPIEIRCYAILFITGLLGFYKKPLLVASLFIGILILRHNHLLIRILLGEVTIKPQICFFAGSAAYAFRKYIVVNYKIALLLITITIVSILVHFYITIFYITFLYTVLTIGTLRFFKAVKLPGDYSYGVYIYGFLIQQTVSFYLPKINSYQSMLLTIPLTLILAIFSWHSIENTNMLFAKRLALRFESSLADLKSRRLKNIKA